MELRLSITNRLKFMSDSDFVFHIRKGNRRVIESFYNKCRKYFMESYSSVFVKESIKEDIFQQSFVKLWTEIETGKIFVDNCYGISRIDRRGNARQLTCSLTTFLIDIAKNDYRDWLRNDRLTLEDDFESFAHMNEIATAVVFETSDDSIMEQIVTQCMLELPNRCKEILTMYYYQGLSLDQILARRGENTSKDGLKTGKYKCMEMLKGKAKQMYSSYML